VMREVTSMKKEIIHEYRCAGLSSSAGSSDPRWRETAASAKPTLLQE